jgi:molecular chaperone GrpE
MVGSPDFPEPAAVDVPGETRNTAPPAVDPASPATDARLDEVLAEVARLREDFLRAKAESENTRRRAQDDVAKAHKFGVDSLCAALLPVKDSLDAALAAGNPSLESLKEGVEITARQLESVFGRNGITEVAPAAGTKFDPNLHQAISTVDAPQDPNTVVSLLQKGYTLHERVLRPALVTVAKAPAAG